MRVVWVKNRFHQFFSHTKTVSGCDRGFNASLVILMGFNNVLDVIELSHYGIKSQPLPSHNTDTSANSPSPTLKSKRQMGSN